MTNWEDAMRGEGYRFSGDVPSSLKVVYFKDIKPSLDHHDFVEGLLCTSAMSVMFGASGCGKTHEAGDLGMHIPLGWPWRGRDVERGGVIYIAAEGGFGMLNRVAAFKKHHNIEGQDIAFAVIPSTVNLLDSKADVDALIQACTDVAERMALPVRLVIVDTLSRAMSGGDENAPDDMGALVANGDRIREATKAHLMFIHHTGKDVARGARGHSILRAATDTEIEISRDDASGIATATVTKQRDLPTEGTWSFRLEQVELGHNHRGKPVTACVALPVEGAPKPTKSKTSLSPATQIALRALREAIAEMGMDAPGSNHIPRSKRVVMTEAWRKMAYARGISEKGQDAKGVAFRRARQDLQARSLIGVWDDWVWLTEE